MKNYKEVNYDTGVKQFGYPSIDAFRNVIRRVQDKTRFIGVDENGDAKFDNLKPLPTLKLVGTTKLHGTNASAVLDLDQEIIYFQSKENVLTPLKDNYGFAGFMTKFQEEFANMVLENIANSDTIIDPKTTNVIVYGEFAGGGIQKNVAINGLPKMFVIFDVRLYNKVDQTYDWLPQNEVKHFKLSEGNILNIYDFKTWEMEIDFNNPELSQNKLQEITLEIENECPVGAELGNKGVGEGAVWRVINDGYNDSGFYMKVKGEKHSVSKVKTLASIDIEKVNSIKEFVETYVTDNRCNQSITKLRESGVKVMDRSILGDFIRWVYNDIVKEELDTIQKNGFDVKELGSPIANGARNWFFKNEDAIYEGV